MSSRLRLPSELTSNLTPPPTATLRAAGSPFVHPECRPDVAALADAVLSTSGMVRWAKERPSNRFLVVTECGLSDRLAMEVPGKEFVRGCKLCTFMKVTTLEDVRDSLRTMRHEITVPEPIREAASRALFRMFEVEKTFDQAQAPPAPANACE